MKLKNNLPLRWLGILIIIVNTWLLTNIALPDDISIQHPDDTNTIESMETVINDNSVIKLSYFYKPPESEEEREIVVKEFDTIILTRLDEWFRDQILDKTDNDVLQYVRFERIHDPCELAGQPDKPCGCDDFPQSNNVGWQEDDICRIRTYHPDWFLRNDEGEVIYGEDETVFMDIGNIEWQSFYLSRLRQSQELDGWHGVFLDNVRGSLGKFEELDEVVPAYPTDESYVEATESFLRFLYNSYFEPNDIPVYANLRSMPLENNDVWERYLAYLDGTMDEFWAVDWGPGYLSPEEWLLGLERAALTQQKGDEFIAVTHGLANDRNRQTFAFASYLLIVDGLASFRYVDDGYNEVLLYDNYKYDFGKPLGAYYYDNGIYRRDFERGYVIVEPVSHAAIIVHNQPESPDS